MAWTYTLIPLLALIAGAVLTVLRTPSPAVRSAVQHFAAGVIFAAAAGELLPDLKHQGHLLSVVVGAGLGVAIMLAIKALSVAMRTAATLVIVTAFDILVDGLVLGIGFAAGAKQGWLLTIALTIEILFLGVAVAIELRGKQSSGARIVAVIAGIGLLLPLGAAVGTAVGALSATYLAAFFAFSLVALLYLVTEELLVEAHEQKEGPFTAALFFLGFLLLLIIEELM